MADEIVLWLKEKCTVATIEQWRAAAVQAQISHVTEPTAVTGLSQSGESISMTVSATPAERLKFISQCREAIALLESAALPPAPGIKLDFSTRCAST